MNLLLVLLAASPTQILIALAKDPIVWVTALTTVIIPLLTAAVTRPSAPDKVKTIVSVILAGVYALVAWLGALSGNVDWKVALVVFVTAAAGAGGMNAAWVSGQVATWLGLKVPINVGPKPLTPEKAAEIHSNNSPLVIPVPVDVVPVNQAPILGVVSENPIDPTTWNPGDPLPENNA